MHGSNDDNLNPGVVVPQKAMPEVVVAQPSCRPTRASLLFHFALLVGCCSSVACASEAQRREELDRTLATAPDPFSPGPFPVASFPVDQGEDLNCSYPHDNSCLHIFAPEGSGVFPIVIFHHGFVLPSDFYSNLLHHVASWGFVVVAPALYHTMGGNPIGHIGPEEEIQRARGVIAWSQGSNLNQALHGNPQTRNVTADPQRVVLAGHSRGGKVAAALALPVDTVLSPSKDETCSDVANECLVTSSSLFAGVALLDPVDGQAPPGNCCDNGCILDPRLTERSSLEFNVPTLVLGTGFGPQKGVPRCPLCVCPCAPRGLGYEKFYDLSQTNGSGKFLFIAHDYGHLDILDKGKNNLATLGVCKAGGDREPLRQFSGGLLVAFLQATVNQNQTFVKVFEGLLKDPESTTVKNIKHVTAECSQAEELPCVDR